MSATVARRAASRIASAPIAVMYCVPLIRLSPSFAASSTLVRPAAASASAAGMRRPSKRASPSPISASARWASGARSPEAPTDPCEGMRGTTPRLSMATSASITSARTPE